MLKEYTMKNPITIAKACNSEVRMRGIDAKELVETARKLQVLMPTSCAALGRVMAITALMGSDLENESGKITVSINGHGPCGTIMCETNGKHEIRGFVGDPNIYMVNEATGKLDVGAAVGSDGTLAVGKDLGMENDQPFVGTIPLQTGEIGDDFAYYYAMSEQIPSVVSLGVLVNPDGSVEVAGGLLIQLLPFASEETIQKVEALVGTMKPLTTYLKDGMTIDEIMESFFDDTTILDHMDVSWHCDCSKDRYLDALSTLKVEELEEIKDQDHGAELVCHFCNHKYDISEEELETLIERKKNV